jgi:translocation and assembly module TamB
MAEAELPDVPVERKARRVLAVLLALLGIVSLLLLSLWLARKPIATDLIDRELARRGVPARYEVKRIGFRTQRLEGLSIGDPRNPDLTAEWVEVDLRPP